MKSLIQRFREFAKKYVLLLYGFLAGRRSRVAEVNSYPIIEASKIKFYADTPNTIIRFDGERNGFFRECRCHLDKKAFLKDLFSDYCSYVYVNGHSADCKELLFEMLEYPKALKHFFYMGDGTFRYSRITRFRKTGDARLIGFGGQYPSWFTGQLLQLVQFAWGPLMEYRYCRGLKDGLFQTFNSSKSAVSKIMADLLGVSSLIPDTYYARLRFDGMTRFGIVVNTASGVAPETLDSKLKWGGVNPLFQKHLLSLWLLDTICYQKDHRPGNYFIGWNESQQLCTISAFDNDCPTTLLPTPNIQMTTYAGIRPMTSKKNRLIRVPYLPCDIFAKILNLDYNIVRDRIGSFCSKVETEMLVRRIGRLKKALRKSLDNGNLTLLHDEEWSTQTMQDELQNSDGLTYLGYFAKSYIE